MHLQQQKQKQSLKQQQSPQISAKQKRLLQEGRRGRKLEGRNYNVRDLRIDEAEKILSSKGNSQQQRPQSQLQQQKRKSQKTMTKSFQQQDPEENESEEFAEEREEEEVYISI